MEWYRVAADEVIGKTVEDFLGNEAYRKMKPHLEKAYAGEQERYEILAPPRMGRSIWLSIVYTPHKANDGEVLGLIVHITDISTPKEIEFALRDSEARFRLLIEEAPVATCLLVGAEMKIEVVNDTMIAYLGKTSDVIGKTLEEAVPEMIGQSFSGILKEAYLTGKTLHERAAAGQIQKEDRLHTYYFDYTFKPLKNAARQVYGILTTFYDVTAQVIAKKAIGGK